VLLRQHAVEPRMGKHHGHDLSCHVGPGKVRRKVVLRVDRGESFVADLRARLDVSRRGAANGDGSWRGGGGSHLGTPMLAARSLAKRAVFNRLLETSSISPDFRPQGPDKPPSDCPSTSIAKPAGTAPSPPP